MAEHMRGAPASLRAHVKVHKSPHIARLEVEAGAIGVGCATVWEAIVMARAGIPDVFVINEVVGAEKVRALALLAREAHVKVAVDDAVAGRPVLSAAAVAAGSTIGVLIDVDEGMHRCGVASAEEALPLARRIADAPGLDFLGLTGYEGHCSLEFDVEKRHAMAREAMALLTGIASRLADEGLPCRIVSAAGTGHLGGHVPLSRRDGDPAGLVRHDGRPPPRPRPALRVGDDGPRDGDQPASRTGSSSTPAARRSAPRTASSRAGTSSRTGSTRSTPSSTSTARARSTSGDTVEILCNYTPFAIGYFEAYHVIEDDRVVDVWPVMPRGPESRWLLDLLERGD